MASIELIMPKMGESIMEATILKWVKQVGDTIEMDETILEIATDKVDSEVPSPVDGVLKEILFQEGDVVEIGKVIATISTESEGAAESNEATPEPVAQTEPATASPVVEHTTDRVSGERFYSPLVRSIAKQEGISKSELDAVAGTGMNGRVTKNDILAYVKNKTAQPTTSKPQKQSFTPPTYQAPPVMKSGNHEIIEMDRMRKLIADHMVMSKHVSPHVTSFVEADVTNIVNWRNRVKKDFQAKHNQKITYTPIFMEAVLKAMADYPMVNVSVEGTNIIKHNDINLGMATALPSGNLIVPVIKNADTLNLLGLTKKVNDLASRARENKLKPDEIQGGTFTITNVGTFGNVMGTPIINQPQVAILAVGAIRKKPAVLETEYGDIIAVRQMMFMSLSYDHRVVDGFLGGSFLKRISDYLEAFDGNRSI